MTATNPVDVANRLEAMGLNEAALREAVNQGYLQRTRLTANHPIIYHGLNMWGKLSLRCVTSSGRWIGSERISAAML